MPLEPIIIKDWKLGIADSAHEGIGLLRNVEIESFPGAVKVSKLPSTLFHSITTRTFTADAASDVCTASGSIEANGQVASGAAVRFTTTGTLPAGLSLNTVYYLIAVTSTTFKVATSYKNSVGSTPGTQINITDAGSGTHTMTQVPIGSVKWILKDARSSYYYVLDSNGRVWFGSGAFPFYLLHNSAIDTGTGSVTNASGNGLVLTPFSSTTQTFLFVFRNNAIDVIDIFGDTAIEALAWSNAWQTMNTTAGTSNSHETIVGQDEIVYFCDARYVGSIKEVAGSVFDPATGGTYTYNNQALDLPSREIAQCLEEQGTNLLIGGNTFNKIYPWDRVSDSFNNPLICPEFYIKKMKNVGGNVYIFPGTWGNIYYTQGTYVKHFKKLPIYVVNNAYSLQSNQITWGAVSQVNGALIFGVAGVTSGSAGLYILYLDGRLVHDNTPSTGTANVTGIYAEDNFFFMGYSGGMDKIGGALYTNYNGVIHSQLYRVSTKIKKATYSQLEIQFAKTSTSDHFRVKYRTVPNGNFSDFPGATIAESLTSNNIGPSFVYDIGLIDIENVQIQVEMDGTLELMEVRLLP